MPRSIGFSTGSLALSDYKSALGALRTTRATAVELSALREDELPALMSDLTSLDLAQFQHVSIHAPSALHRLNELELVQSLAPAIEHGFPIVVHADIIKTASVWRKLGTQLLIENMDKRKSTGRTAQELQPLFIELPKARLCLDLAHARQVDPSLFESISLLTEFGARVDQLHLSELNARSRHEPLSFSGVSAMQYLGNLLPPNAPIILEFEARPNELNGYLDLIELMLRPKIGIAREAV